MEGWATRQCTGRETNWRSLDHKSDALNTTLPSQPNSLGYYWQMIIVVTEFLLYARLGVHSQDLAPLLQRRSTTGLLHSFFLLHHPFVRRLSLLIRYLKRFPSFLHPCRSRSRRCAGCLSWRMSGIYTIYDALSSRIVNRGRRRRPSRRYKSFLLAISTLQSTPCQPAICDAVGDSSTLVECGGTGTGVAHGHCALEVSLNA